jgi:NAD(P)-dependent dehydrogenase (short-subunit alcohol dehydrogenase family)
MLNPLLKKSREVWPFNFAFLFIPTLNHVLFSVGGRAVTAICSAEDGDTIVQIAVKEFGGIHALIANAGILRDRSFTAMAEQEWDQIIAVHLRLVIFRHLRLS